MSHLSSTMARVDDEEKAAVLASLPGIGTGVSFRLRGGEYRNGADTFAAIVSRVHADTGLIDVVVVLDADDFMGQQGVPALSAGFGWGWAPAADSAAAGVAALRADFDAFKRDLGEVVFGGNERSDLSLYDMIAELREVASLKVTAASKAARKNPKAPNKRS